MFKAQYTAKAIFRELSERQSTYKVIDKQLPGGSKTTGLIRVESKKRQDCKNLIVDILKEMKQPYKEMKVANISSFPHLLITSLITQNKGAKPEKLRIVFKFPNDSDKPDYGKMWNQNMLNFFATPGGRALKRVPKNRHEVSIISEINASIFDASETPVTVSIGKVKAHNIIGVIGGVGNKHADLVFISDTKPYERIFLTYKSGFNATDFQQYSGISRISGLAGAPEVKKFKGDVVRNDIKEGWRPIKTARLKRNAVMGSKAANGSLAKGNHSSCQVFAQGTPVVSGSESGVKITFDKVVTNTQSQVATLDGTTYEPTLGVRKGEASRKIVAPGGIFGAGTMTGVRGGIYTRAYLEKRKGNDQVE